MTQLIALGLVLFAERRGGSLSPTPLSIALDGVLGDVSMPSVGRATVRQSKGLLCPSSLFCLLWDGVSAKLNNLLSFVPRSEISVDLIILCDRQSQMWGWGRGRSILLKSRIHGFG